MSKRDSVSKSSLTLPRREFLKAGGALVIGFSSAGLIDDALFAQGPAIARGRPIREQIDTWLAIHSDNTATVYIGFVELGQGSTTSLLQVAAEELDLDMSQVNTVRLDTDITPNQGGTYSSASIARGGPPIRTAAAEARHALLAAGVEETRRAGGKLDGLEGRRVLKDSARKSVTYGELIGDKPFNLAFTGTAPLKPVRGLQTRRHAPAAQRHSRQSERQVCLHAARAPARHAARTRSAAARPGRVRRGREGC